MIIGIISAINEEINFFKKKINKTKKKKYKTIKITKGKINNIKIILIESGIGKTSATIATTIMITKYHPNYIINIGSAGSLKKKIQFQNIIIVNKLCYHDVNITSFKYKIGQIPNFPQYFICDKNIIKYIIYICIINKISFNIGNIVSGDFFLDKHKKKKEIKNTFPKSICIDMEATSIAQTCYLFKTKFICIKIISDKSNSLSNKDFYKNINLISQKISFILLKIINKIYFY